MNIRENIESTYKLLDGLSALPCEASVYTLTDDEFDLICHARDTLYEVIEELNKPLMLSYEESIIDMQKKILDAIGEMNKCKITVKNGD